MSKDFSAALRLNGKFVVAVMPKVEFEGLWYGAKRRLELVRDCRLNNSEFLRAALELVVLDCEGRMREKLRSVGELK